MAALGSMVLAGPVRAQSAAAEPGSRLTVYLMTMGTGRRVWERFGHNAIWIHDPVYGTDQTYNYGLFDFRQDNFLLRFIRGRMWYWMAGYPAHRYVEQYRRDNRSVWVQELNLPPRARLELQEFLQWNERPDNRFYHYDYYRDNCSTRVRDAIDRVLEGRIKAQTEGRMVAASYRFHTQRLTANDPLIFTGLLLALGKPVDRPLSAWEEMFLPLELRVRLREVTVPGPGGTTEPLVISERTLFESSAPAPPDAPPSWLGAYLAMGLTIGLGARVLGRKGAMSDSARIGFTVLVGSWAVVVFAAGTVLAFLWWGTDHVMASANENLFQLNPLAGVLGLSLLGLKRGSPGRTRFGAGVATVLATLSLAGLVAQLLPGMDQVNGPIIALALPAHLGTALGLRAFAQGPRTR